MDRTASRSDGENERNGGKGATSLGGVSKLAREVRGTMVFLCPLRYPLVLGDYLRIRYLFLSPDALVNYPFSEQFSDCGQ